MKVHLGMPLPQTTGFVESLLRLAGLDWKFPEFSTLWHRQKTLNVAIPNRGGTEPLHLLIDATGINAEAEPSVTFNTYSAKRVPKLRTSSAKVCGLKGNYAETAMRRRVSRSISANRIYRLLHPAG